MKFRGKRLDKGEWMYGDLLRNENGAFAVVPPFRMNSRNECSDYEVDKDTIGQFTGLHDRNGKEIYEDDIIHFAEDGNGFTALVKWNEEIGAWCMQLSYEPQLGSRPLGEWLKDERFEVIGNVFDNPELLKGGRR